MFFGGGGFPFGGMGGNPFDDLFGSFHAQRKRTVPDKIIEVEIGTIESFNSSDKVINYQRAKELGIV